MLRALALAALVLAVPGAAAFQAPPDTGVLHMKVVLVDAARTPMPVPRHALLISDNPATSTPRRVLTGPDGTADVRLRPGSYTVESEAPFVFQGKAYEWRQVIDIVAGRDKALELTSANAEIAAVTPGATTTSEAPSPSGLSSMLVQWQDSVITLWTPLVHASGFVIEADGLIATNQRVIGAATSVEVQIADDLKVAANVLVSDADRDVAVLAVAPEVTASLRPVPLGCAETSGPVVKAGDELFTIGAPLRQPKGPAFAVASGVERHRIASDFLLPNGSAGGPVFGSGGVVIGITSIVDERSADPNPRHGDVRIVPVEDVCDVVASAREKRKTAAPPSAMRLPTESSKPVPEQALRDIAQRRVGSLNPYQASSADFDVAFITPVMIYGVQHLSDQMSARNRGRGGRPADDGQLIARPQFQFGNWFEYVADLRPVLLVRVTPRLVEGFWTKVARGAAQAQGVALPAYKRMRTGFARMRAFCGDVEITPVHPFKVERRVSGTETAYEGLYVFDHGAIAPSCGRVTLELFGEKEPQKGDTRVVDAKLVEQIWQDFAAYRAVSSEH